MTAGGNGVMLRDLKKVTGLVIGDTCISIGQWDVGRIEVVWETGQCAEVPWFAVYGPDDSLRQMVNAAHVTIVHCEQIERATP